MTEKAEALLVCLIVLFIFLGGCIALIGWDEFNAPVETPKRARKPSFEEQY